MDEVPETADFLEIAKRNGMVSADFMALTSFLNSYGWKVMQEVLEGVRSEEGIFGARSRDRSIAGPYVWPFLRKELIFDAVDVTDKTEFLENVLGLISERTEQFGIEPALSELLEREAVTGSGIGEGVAVPHAYLAELTTMIVTFVRIPEGLDFDAIDGKPVDLAIVLLGPRSAENLHLKLLARIAKLLSYKNFRNRLLAASDEAEVISIFREAELGIP
jgi:mannitol/fructose-specific phosphotransferase system IIA component (Ntr-type)